ncbi:MAG: pyridoxamine 5'-phosphate oxidase [Pacificimonas sp.]|jgi:pyridoxamine 5'-phosphate oxidase|nr:pyridoxamine 5'-phosphate oxidase [Pacificimonas sp.]
MTSDPGTSSDPFSLFAAWMAEAEASEPNDPNAMALATAGPAGPSVRMVLLKGISEGGFVFYTNAESRKGGDLAESETAALLFHWKTLRRQIRISGPVAPVSEDESDAYFATRPRGSQIGAWASQQSRPLSGRDELTKRTAMFTEKFAGRDVPRPDHWFGWRVIPDQFEYWIDRDSRMHERYLFTASDGGWTRGQLYP